MPAIACQWSGTGTLSTIAVLRPLRARPGRLRRTFVSPSSMPDTVPDSAAASAAACAAAACCIAIALASSAISTCHAHSNRQNDLLCASVAPEPYLSPDTRPAPQWAQVVIVAGSGVILRCGGGRRCECTASASSRMRRGSANLDEVKLPMMLAVSAAAAHVKYYAVSAHEAPKHLAPFSRICP